MNYFGRLTKEPTAQPTQFVAGHGPFEAELKYLVPCRHRFLSSSGFVLPQSDIKCNKV